MTCLRERSEAWLSRPEIIIIKGVRRCGKSFILQQVASRLKGKAAYVNFDDYRLLPYLGLALLDEILAAYPNIEYFFFDEVQKIPQFESWLRTYYDIKTHKKFIISESSISLLCLGAKMHNAFCVFKGGRAVLSQYMGTTSNAATFEHYKRMVRKLLDFTRTEPEKIVADLHPQYNTSLYAEELAAQLGVPLVRVQHHRAHACSAAAEHGLLGPDREFAAIVCDGLGYGDDGAVGGGEVFRNDRRIGHLQEHLHLGGDAATRFPARMLYSVLRTFLSQEEAGRHVVQHIPAKDLAVLERQREARFNSPLTTSTGRVFDAAAALLGICSERTYEGRPAMLLEASSTKPYDLEPVIRDSVLMTTPLFEYLVANLERDRARLAATVQQYAAEGLYSIAAREKKPLVFSGGCAYSRVMTSFLAEKGVLVNEQVPAGDGGISSGQAAACLSQRV